MIVCGAHAQALCVCGARGRARATLKGRRGGASSGSAALAVVLRTGAKDGGLRMGAEGGGGGRGRRAGAEGGGLTRVLTLSLRPGMQRAERRRRQRRP